MVAKTFDTNDPDHYEAYLAESVIQITLYGGVYLIRGEGGWITVYDGVSWLQSRSRNQSSRGSS